MNDNINEAYETMNSISAVANLNMSAIVSRFNFDMSSVVGSDGEPTLKGISQTEVPMYMEDVTVQSLVYDDLALPSNDNRILDYRPWNWRTTDLIGLLSKINSTETTYVNPDLEDALLEQDKMDDYLNLVSYQFVGTNRGKDVAIDWSTFGAKNSYGILISAIETLLQSKKYGDKEDAFKLYNNMLRTICIGKMRVKNFCKGHVIDKLPTLIIVINDLCEMLKLLLPIYKKAGYDIKLDSKILDKVKVSNGCIVKFAFLDSYKKVFRDYDLTEGEWTGAIYTNDDYKNAIDVFVDGVSEIWLEDHPGAEPLNTND